jgi:hypothetical protein
MNASKESGRVRRRTHVAPEVLEGRLVMSASQGSTFAITPGAIKTAGQAATIDFKIDPTLFSSPKGRMALGIDVAPAVPTSSGSGTTTSMTATLKPELVSVTDSSGRRFPLQHSRYSPAMAKANHLGGTLTSAVLVTLPVPASGKSAADYTLSVKGLDHTTGQFLVGFYLPADVAGSGTVTQADIQTIKKELRLTANNPNYTFDADVNRDGVINRQDLSIAQQNLGVTTKVSPVVSVNLDPNSDPAANRTSPYSTIHFAGKATPGASIKFVDQTSNASTTTTVAADGTYSIMVPLVRGSNTFTVTTNDGFGQSISGAISPVVYSPTSAATTPGTNQGSGSTG